MYTRLKFGPRPRSVPRARGVQSRENWQVTTGSVSDYVEPTRPIGTQHHFRKYTARFVECVRLQATTTIVTISKRSHHHQQEVESRAAYCCCCSSSFTYGTAAPPPPSSAPSSTDCSFLTLHDRRKSLTRAAQLLVSVRKSRGCLAGACKATTSSDFPKQPRRHSVAPNSTAVEQQLYNTQ